jgi:hypothetical protein
MSRAPRFARLPHGSELVPHAIMRVTPVLTRVPHDMTRLTPAITLITRENMRVTPKNRRVTHVITRLTPEEISRTGESLRRTGAISAGTANRRGQLPAMAGELHASLRRNGVMPRRVGGATECRVEIFRGVAERGRENIWAQSRALDAGQGSREQRGLQLRSVQCVTV